jgi:histidinol phosphatase-like enzyme
MFVQAKKKWDVDIKNSYVVGDKPSDMLFARNSNLKGILINKDDNLYTKVIKVIKNDVF